MIALEKRPGLISFALVLGSQVADFLTFIPALAVFGVGGETNFIMGWAYNVGGLGLVAIIKVLGIAYFVGGLFYLASVGSRLTPLHVSLVTTIGLVGVLSNLLAIAYFSGA